MRLAENLSQPLYQLVRILKDSNFLSTNNYSFDNCVLCVCHMFNARYTIVDFALNSCQTNSCLKSL